MKIYWYCYFNVIITLKIQSKHENVMFVFLFKFYFRCKCLFIVTNCSEEMNVLLVHASVKLPTMSLLPLGNLYLRAYCSVPARFVINTVTPVICSMSLANISQQAWHWQMEAIIAFVKKVCTYVCLLLWHMRWWAFKNVWEMPVYTGDLGVSNSKLKFKSILDFRDTSWYKVHAKELADLSSDPQNTC